jgi:hypothetical protein
MTSNTLRILLPLLLITSFSTYGQHEELKQNINAFVDEKADNFEKKFLNETEPDYGELANTNYNFHDFFELKAKEKTENSIGNNVKLKLQCSFYGYENETERTYALSFWFKNFIAGKRITPGRTVRTYKGAEPTIIIINEDHIVVVSMACTSYDPDLFRELRKELVAFFGNVDSMVVEINCDGPLDWTKNAPDPKDKKWRM